MQGFVYFSEQTHQSQSQWVCNGIGDNVYTGVQANHKERDAPEAPPLLLVRARAITSNPLAKDRSTMAKCFNQSLHQNIILKKDPHTHTSLAGDRWIVAKCFTNTQYSNFCRSLRCNATSVTLFTQNRFYCFNATQNMVSLRITSIVSM